MNEVLIKIKIAGREYPLKINPEEEPQLREAARRLQNALSDSQQQTGIMDKQDLLAMAAFDLTVKSLQQEETTKASKGTLDQIDQMLDKMLDEA